MPAIKIPEAETDGNLPHQEGFKSRWSVKVFHPDMDHPDNTCNEREKKRPGQFDNAHE